MREQCALKWRGKERWAMLGPQVLLFSCMALIESRRSLFAIFGVPLIAFPFTGLSWRPINASLLWASRLLFSMWIASIFVHCCNDLVCSSCTVRALSCNQRSRRTFKWSSHMGDTGNLIICNAPKTLAACEVFLRRI